MPVITISNLYPDERSLNALTEKLKPIFAAAVQDPEPLRGASWTWIDSKGRLCRADHRRLVRSALENRLRPIDLMGLRVRRYPLLWVIA